MEKDKEGEKCMMLSQHGQDFKREIKLGIKIED
jgi:hypothetical protein